MIKLANHKEYCGFETGVSRGKTGCRETSSEAMAPIQWRDGGSLNPAGDWAGLEARLDRLDGDLDCRSVDLSGGKEGHQGQCPGPGWGSEMDGDNIYTDGDTT